MIRAENVSHFFREGEAAVLREVSLEIKKKDFIVVEGESGTGKTTLLQIMSGLLAPSAGKVFFDEKDLSSFGAQEMSRFRNKKIAFVFQEFFLIPNLTVEENVQIPLLFSKEKREVNVDEVLDSVGILDIKKSLLTDISGGQKQRVAISRALINSPEIIFADEPTGNLDRNNASEILKLFLDLNQNKDIAFFIATHDNKISQAAKKLLTIKGGRVVSA